jgi:HlyD family secretion protein
MKSLNLRPLIALAVLILFGGGGWYLDSQRARQRNVLSGYFESQPAELSSRIGGRTARILVKEGDSVTPGQPLLVFEATPARHETEAKQAAAEQANAQVQEVVNGPRVEDIRKQKAAVAEATAALAHLRNGPLPEEIGGAQARVRQAEAVYRKTKTGARPQEIAQARAAEQNARAKLAQAERGPTREERAEARARLDAAIAQENLAAKEVERMTLLFNEGAISRQQLDRTTADRRSAEARRRELEEAWKRTEAGTPAEELRQVQEAYRQAKAGLDLVLAGSRREDIDAAREELTQAQEALKLIRRGTRVEDIRAGEARLAKEEATLAELQAGNRREQIAQAKAAEKAAKATARSAETNMAEQTLRAPKAGIVERILTAEGDLVSQGTPVIRMALPDDLWLRIYVPESKLAQVTVGSEARIRVDSVEEALPAIVESVATRGEFTPANLQTPNERGKQVFGIRLRLAHPDRRVKAGMPATVERIGKWEPR